MSRMGIARFAQACSVVFPVLLVACASPTKPPPAGSDAGLLNDLGERGDAETSNDAGDAPCTLDSACGESELCESGRCVPRSCVPSEVSCADATNLKTCNARGDGYVETMCGAGLWCIDGACAFACPSELTNCADSCRDLLTDRVNCGACGNTCDAGDVCSMGVCTRSCEAGLTECSGSCRDLLSDRAHCGACGNICDAGDVCSMGVCTRSCEAGLTECSGSCVDLSTSERHCGMCEAACPPVAGAIAACAAFRCGFFCATGRADCDRLTATGCETDLETSPSHCGACGTVCTGAPNATPACTSSACGFDCNRGFADCDGVPVNGCEVDTSRSAFHCGACGTQCGSGLVCVGGLCTSDGVGPDGGLDPDGGTPRRCVPTCTTDADCQSSCPANPTPSLPVCCDRGTGTCFNSSVAMCPPPATIDGGIVMSM
jgi:hypothetical protein